MKDRCWICKKWEEHFYWDHFEESNFHFMKVMNGDFTQKMELPPKFAKNFRVELIDVVELEAPSGKLWEIGLCKEQDHLYFNGGWEKFIEENEVEEYYILIFEYAGDSKFQVRIYDRTGCVRAASNLIDNTRAKQKNVDQTLQNFHNSHSSRTDCNDHPMLHEQPTDNRSDFSKVFIKDEEHGMGKDKDDGRIVYSRNCKKEVAELQPEAKLSLMSLRYKVRILERKFGSKQGNCSFVKLFTWSMGARPFMAIPLAFVSKHLPQKPNGITVYNQSNKKWYVNCSCRSSSWGFAGKSLFTLLQENKIQKGDACVFELKEKGKVVELQMRIVSAKEVLSILTKECL
ncbi:B3 domain-containing protein Os03g0622100-like [Dendrobium catenatum]|uniref:B3 domain-containing protein n=1 Tax=Dendrobium catenatum TaxID=906689 RepID=A0A2I0VPW3_9ASPA|nr:B3 domain-containing protein Os03g0622100-like [Dendrobium catenatum]XP_028556273.1 B3 domain-containing protein Os03g0622100-like [Dendrobium catenatum]PKU65451.1 B3 domain-containing protein [Dendrobium catenatum]